MRIFENRKPVMGQDPHLTKYQGRYLLSESLNEERIALSYLTDKGREGTKIVWAPKEYQIWAPELHRVDGHYFIYYSSSSDNSNNHRMKVIGAASDPFGPYYWSETLDKDNWGIDLTTFTWKGLRYAIWSGWKEPTDMFPQHLYIAPMPSPVEIGKRILLTSPELEWEKSIAPINEGPQAFIENGKLYLLYSANASWMPQYSTGVLALIGEDPLNSDHWVKCPWPLITNAGHGMVLGDRFIYHRKMSNLSGWLDREIAVINKEKFLENGRFDDFKSQM